jgi:hypothetical protein
VDQFRPKASTQLTAVKAGQGLRSGDEFVCDEAGRARFKLDGNGAVLLGPRARIHFLNTSEERAPQIRLLKGELGIERGTRLPSATDWVVLCGPWRVRITPETKLYVKMNPETTTPPVVSVLIGVAHVGLSEGQGDISLAAGQKATLSGDVPTVEKKAALPEWRADLCTVEELREMISGISQVVERNSQGLLVELKYGFGRTSLGNDWRPQKNSPLLSINGGVLHIPNGSRCRLAALLAAPLEVEATVSANAPKNCPWGLALQCGEKKNLSLDLGKEAVLNVNVKPVPRVARIGYRTSSQAAERVRLTVTPKGEGEAILSTAAGKTQPVPVPKKLLQAGTLQIEALSEGLTLDGLRIQGVLPREWIFEHLKLSD